MDKGYVTISLEEYDKLKSLEAENKRLKEEIEKNNYCLKQDRFFGPEFFGPEFYKSNIEERLDIADRLFKKEKENG